MFGRLCQMHEGTAWAHGLLWLWWVLADKWGGHEEEGRGGGITPQKGRCRHWNRDFGWEAADWVSVIVWDLAVSNYKKKKVFIPAWSQYNEFWWTWLGMRVQSSAKTHNQHSAVLCGPGFSVSLRPLPPKIRLLLNEQYFLDSCGIRFWKTKLRVNVGAAQNLCCNPICCIKVDASL